MQRSRRSTEALAAQKACGAGGAGRAQGRDRAPHPCSRHPRARIPGWIYPRRRAAAAGRAAEANFAEWLLFKNNSAFVSRSGLLQIEESQPPQPSPGACTGGSPSSGCSGCRCTTDVPAPPAPAPLSPGVQRAPRWGDTGLRIPQTSPGSPQVFAGPGRMRGGLQEESGGAGTELLALGAAESRAERASDVSAIVRG